MADKDFVVKNGISVNGSVLVVNSSTGTVGINTSVHDAAFKVVGTANISGNVVMSSNLTVSGNVYGTLQGTANNTLNLGGTSAASYALNSSVTANATTAYSNAIAFSANATTITTGTLDTARLPATANITTALNVGANVTLGTAQLSIGGVTVNSTVIAGGANTVFNIVNASSIVSGNTTVNSTLISTTGNVVANVITGNGVNITSINASTIGGNTITDIRTFASNATNITTGTLDTARLPAIANITTSLTVGTNTFFAANSNIGIGAAAQNHKVIIVGNTDGNRYLLYISNGSITNTAANSTLFRIDSVANNATTTSISTRAANFSSYASPYAGNITGILGGVEIAVTNQMNGNTLSSMYGSITGIDSQGGANTTNMAGTYTRVENSGTGTVTSAIGYQANVTGIGRINNATGIDVNISSSNTTTSTGIKTNGINATATAYAIYTGTVTAPTKYSIFQSDSTANNYFAAPTTIDANLTYGGTTLSNTVTGTGSMVLSISPTLTGTLTIGNTTVNSTTVNSSFFTGTANNTTYVGTVTVANVVSNAQLIANLANYQTSAGLSANVATLAANSSTYVGGNTATTLRAYSDTMAATAYSNAIAFSAIATNITSGTLNTARLPATANITTALNVGANVNLSTSSIVISNTTSNTTVNILAASINIGNTTVNTTVNSSFFTGTANNTTYVGTVTVANVVSNAQLIANLANYQTSAGLSANVATLAANSSTYVGGNTATTLRAYSDTMAATAYSNAVANAVANATTLAATAYSNAINISANATTITTGTLNTARLPATANITTALNVGANVTVNTTSITTGSNFIANNTVVITPNTVTIGTATYSVANGNFGIGTNTPGYKLDVNGIANISAAIRLGQAIIETYAAPSISAGTLNVDLSTATVFNVSVNANITTFTISNATSSKAQAFTLFLKGNGTGYSQTWGSSVKWAGGSAPTLTTTLNKTDIITFVTNDGGTTWFAFIGGQNF